MEAADKKVLKVGPFGSDRTDRFDDGVHSAVRQVEICYNSSIRYVKIEYDDNGKSYWSQKHGHHGSMSSADEVANIKLDYPDEYLTSIHGYYRSGWFLPTYICSLTFTSNRKVYGPYGDYNNMGRTYFSIQASGSKIVGFHGRSDDRVDLRAIGAYLEPIVQKQEYSVNNTPAPVAHTGYPAAYNNYTLPPPPPYYGNYYNDPNQPPQADPTAYQYGNYNVPPPGPPLPYNYGYNNDYQVSQALPPGAARGRPTKPKSAPSKPKKAAAAADGSKNVSYRVSGNEVSGNTGDRNGVFNVGNKNTGRHMDDDDEDED